MLVGIASLPVVRRIAGVRHAWHASVLVEVLATRTTQRLFAQRPLATSWHQRAWHATVGAVPLAVMHDGLLPFQVFRTHMA